MLGRRLGDENTIFAEILASLSLLTGAHPLKGGLPYVVKSFFYDIKKTHFLIQFFGEAMNSQTVFSPVQIHV